MRISRTKPSIVASERFARAPSIDVFCRAAGIAVIDATQQPVNRQKRRIRFIDGDEYISAASASIKVTGVNRPLHSRPESATRHSGRTASNPTLCCRRQVDEKRASRGRATAHHSISALATLLPSGLRRLVPAMDLPFLWYGNLLDFDVVYFNVSACPPVR